MSYSQTVENITTLGAAADYSATPHRLLVNDAAGTYLRAAGATIPFAGVLLNKPAAGEPAECAKVGHALVESGAAVVAGTKITSDATGRGITTSTSGHYFAGVAIDAAAGAGELIRVEITTGTVA